MLRFYYIHVFTTVCFDDCRCVQCNFVSMYVNKLLGYLLLLCHFSLCKILMALESEHSRSGLSERLCSSNTCQSSSLQPFFPPQYLFLEVVFIEKKAMHYQNVRVRVTHVKCDKFELHRDVTTHSVPVNFWVLVIKSLIWKVIQSIVSNAVEMFHHYGFHLSSSYLK